MKYITHFATEAEYQTALPSLDLPNVSLVDELGEVHYHRALYGAHAGDIALYDVAEGQKIVVTAADWNLTTYPTATYPIIGIVAFDETAAGCLIFRQKGVNADGTESSSGYTKLRWQGTTFNWGLTKYSTEETAVTDMNGKSNTTAIINAIKAYDTANGTDNITGYIGQALQNFSTAGTSIGDWFVASMGQIINLKTNLTTINTTLAKINNADSTLSIPSITLDSTDFFKSSTENDITYSYVLGGSFASRITRKSKNDFNINFIPFTII